MITGFWEENEDEKPEDEEGAADIGGGFDDEDEGGEDGEEDEGGQKPRDIKKLALIVGVPVLLLVGGGAGLYFSGMLDSLLGKGATAEHAGEGGHDNGAAEEDRGSAKHAGAHFLEIPNIVVNLASDGGQPRYLRLSIHLELDSEEEVQAVEAVLPRVIDQFQTYLRELRVKDLRGSAGIYRLQMELLSRVNAAAYPVKVRDVLFQEILIQ